MINLSQVCGSFIQFRPSGLDTAFDTGFVTFRALCGVGGLAKEDPETKTLEVLAVHADKPRSGQFRRFVAQLKSSYEHVSFIHEFSPILAQALDRYGFHRVVEKVGPCETATVWRWDR